MGWKDAMSERARLVVLAESGERTIAGLSRELGISRKTAYKWIERYELQGIEGLKDESRAPHTHPQETSEDIQDLVVRGRKLHRTWGPKKLKAWLEREHQGMILPAASTIGDLLKAEGLVKARRRRKGLPDVGRRPIVANEPNDEWDADFKGEFRLGNGEYCYPLTITDAYSRFLLKAKALKGTGTEGTRRGFEEAFGEYGLPRVIRTDNGCPFASTALGRISSLSVWWMRLGIGVITTRPGKPQDNGRHERMHRTMKAEATRPPERDHRSQQIRLGAFQREYNDDRPHEALGQQTPAEVYVRSNRTYKARLDPIEYPGHFEVRSVTTAGVFCWGNQPVFISAALANEQVGLVEIQDRVWKVFFGNIELGILNELDCAKRKTGRVLPMSPV
jgi:transposase InsO family protein